MRIGLFDVVQLLPLPQSLQGTRILLPYVPDFKLRASCGQGMALRGR